MLEGRKEKLKQGVTLEVVGNCGFSPFPHSGDVAACASSDRAFWVARMAGVGRRGRVFQAMAESGAKDSALSLVGHGSLRIAVCGPGQGTPTQTQLDQMAGVLDESLAAGCAGFSTGLMYAPGSSAEAPELEHLCRVVARRGKFYATHMRSYSNTLLEATREQIALAERTPSAVCRFRIYKQPAAGIGICSSQR